jgi:hypothetical protein
MLLRSSSIGHYHIQHSQPDGDSIHFQPNDLTAFGMRRPAVCHLRRAMPTWFDNITEISGRPTRPKTLSSSEPDRVRQ